MRDEEAPAPIEFVARSPSGCAALRKLDDDEADAIADMWRGLARGKQDAPEGDWRVWLLLAGRGFGKTRSGAEWVRARVEDGLARPRRAGRRRPRPTRAT